MAGKEMVFRIFEQAGEGAALPPRQVLKAAREQFDPICKLPRIELAMWRLAEMGVFIRERGRYRLSRST